MVDPKLITLLKVADTGNHTRAAEELSLTQPAVSQHIKQLEKELGIHIFNRVGGRLKPTQEGAIAIDYARRITTLYTNLTQELMDNRRKISRLRVGITHTSESNVVTEALAQYSHQREGVIITIRTDTINNLYEMLRKFEVDLAIVEGNVSDPDISSLLLDTDFLVLALSKDHPLAQKSMVTINELRNEKMILRLPDSGTRNLFVAHLESHNMSLDDFNVVLEVDNIATIKDLIGRNYGVSILAKSACMDEVKKGKLAVLPVENLTMVREVNILYHRTFRHTEILRDFVHTYNVAAKMEHA